MRGRRGGAGADDADRPSPHPPGLKNVRTQHRAVKPFGGRLDVPPHEPGRGRIPDWLLFGVPVALLVCGFVAAMSLSGRSWREGVVLVSSLLMFVAMRCFQPRELSKRVVASVRQRTPAIDEAEVRWRYKANRSMFGVCVGLLSVCGYALAILVR